MRDSEWNMFLLVGERQKGLLTLKWFKLPKMQCVWRWSSHLWQVDNVSWLRHVVGNILRRLNSSQLNQTLSRLLQDLVSKSCSIMVMYVWVVVWLSTESIYRIRVHKMNQPCENGWHSLHLGKSIGKQLCSFGVSLSLTWEKLMSIFGNKRGGQAPE